MANTENEQNLTQGVTDLVQSTWDYLKGATSLETLDHIALGVDLTTVAIKNYFDTFPQAALVASVAKLRMIDAIANLADVTQKIRDGDASAQLEIQLVSAVSQAVGATGMWLEGFGKILAADATNLAVNGALVEEIGSAMNWGAAALTVGTEGVKDFV